MLAATHAKALDTQARAHASELEATEATWALSRKEYELAAVGTGRRQGIFLMLLTVMSTVILLLTTPMLHFRSGAQSQGGCNGTTRTDVAPTVIAPGDVLAPIYALAQPGSSAGSLVASGRASTAALAFGGETQRPASAALVLSLIHI